MTAFVLALGTGKEHLQSGQEAKRQVYNRSAKVMNFQVGNQVVVVILIVEAISWLDGKSYLRLLIKLEM